MLSERSAELREVSRAEEGQKVGLGETILASTSGPRQGEDNFVILSLMIALHGKGEVVICSCV